MILLALHPGVIVVNIRAVWGRNLSKSSPIFHNGLSVLVIAILVGFPFLAYKWWNTREKG